jgi:L-alanine-DL-glutamate epimerase-like enolase superfamily enzyme
MQTESLGPIALEVAVETWPLTVPFRITGHTWDAIEVVVVTLEKSAVRGRGEAAGVYYRRETVASITEDIERCRTALQMGLGREQLQSLVPAGGARNAIDCALWELEARLTGRAVWQLAGLGPPKPVLTTFGCGAEQPEQMASAARAYKHARAIKLKLTGEPIDADRVRAVREARPDVWLAVDANQGFTLAFLEQLMPILQQSGVSLIEQPLPAGQEGLLAGFRSPIPLAADESVQTRAQIPAMVGRFDVINIKLDKSGGLTEGLAMARMALDLGLDVMVGNMIGTSLAMAPAFILGQFCKFVDLDGPPFLQHDRPVAVDYVNGMIVCSESVWGGARDQDSNPQ